MLKLAIFMRRKPGLTHQEFRDYYEQKHAPFGLQQTGSLISGYRRNYMGPELARLHAELGLPPLIANGFAAASHDEAGYDCVTEVLLEDEAAVRKFLQRIADGVGAILAEDEDRFLDRSSVRMMIVEGVDSKMPTNAR